MAGEVARLFISVGADVAQAMGGLNDLSGRLRGVGQSAALTGGMLTAGLTLPLAGVAKEAVGAAMDVQQQMNVLQAISGATDSQLQTLRQTAVDLGADMTLPATSAQDASAAMLELAKAGLSVDNVLGATKGTLMLAAAAHMSEAEAAEVSANALNAFKLRGEDAMFVADQLAATANASSVEANEVAYSFKQAASAFSAFQSPALGAKGAITELNTAVGILGNMGLKGEMAGSALKMTLLELTAPSIKAKALMANLAASIGESGDLAYNAAGQMRSLPEILDILRRSTAAMTEEERNYTITKIFGADASKAVIALMQAGKDGWDQMSASVTKAGAAQDFTNASTKGLKGALDGLKSTVETLALEAGTPFLGTLEGWTRNLAGLLSGISAVDPRILAMVGTFLAVLAVAGPAVLLFGLLATALGFLLSPVGLVVLGIAALAALFAGNVGGIASFANSLWVLTQGFLSGSVSLQQFLNQVGLLLGRFLAPLRENFAQLLSQLGDLVPRIVAEGARLAEAFVAWVGPAAGQMVTALLDLGLQLIYWLAGQVGPIANQLLAWAKAFLDWIGPMAIQALNALLVFLGQVTDWIVANAPTLLATLIGEWVPAAIGWVAQAAIDIIPKLLDFLGTIGNWIVTTGIPKFVEYALRIGAAIVKGILDGLEGLAQKLIDLIGAAVQSIHLDFGWIVIDGRNGVSLNLPTPSLPSLPGFAAGGVVPGPEGAPMLAVVHGGEEVLTPEERRRGGGGTVNNYYLTANYAYQNERSLRDDIRLLQMLGANL